MKKSKLNFLLITDSYNKNISINNKNKEILDLYILYRKEYILSIYKRYLK